MYKSLVTDRQKDPPQLVLTQERVQETFVHLLLDRTNAFQSITFSWPQF